MASTTAIDRDLLRTSSLRIRLSLLMFLQYSVLGAWVPLFALRLHELQLPPLETSWIFATFAVASVVGPLIGGQIADRWVSVERCICVAAGVGGGFLFVIAELQAPWAIFAACFGHWLFMVCAVTLGTSLCFRQLDAPDRDFGRVRLWGTVGWIVPGLVLAVWFRSPHSELADMLRLAGVLSLLLAVYALTLPHTPPLKPAGEQLQPPLAGFASGWLTRLFDAPLSAMRLCRQRSFAVYCLCSLGLYATISFNSQLTPLLFRQLGFKNEDISLVLPISQVAEVLTLAFLPVLLLRLNVRGTLVLGLACWATALGILTLGGPTELVIGSLLLIGVCVCCFMVAGQLYVNGRAGPDFRASVQGFLALMNGLGLLIGHLAVGWIRSVSAGELRIGFASAASLAAVLVVVFLVGFSGGD